MTSIEVVPTTGVTHLWLVDAESELQQACNTPECSSVAEWAGWGAHVVPGCDVTAMFCTPCKDAILADARKTLAEMSYPCVCATCSRPVSSQVSDNYRFIKL